MFTETVIWSGFAVFLIMNMFYGLAMWQKNAGLVDIAWGLGFVAVAWSLLLSTSTLTSTQIIITSLITIWGARLAWHLGRRNIGQPEDWRYAQMRKDWGKAYWWRSYLMIFMFQGLLMLIISAPTIVAFASLQEQTISILAYLGVLVWTFGFVIETIADGQLRDFMARKKAGKTKSKFLTTGLWRYSRHPNYFGEATQWWGLWLVVSSLPYGLWALASPLLITYLILYVSGVPMLEKKFSKDKSWRVYASKTSKFVLLPPRS